MQINEKDDWVNLNKDDENLKKIWDEKVNDVLSGLYMAKINGKPASYLNEIVWVQWKDATAADGGWAFKSDWVKKLATIRSTGTVVYEDAECITIMPHFSEGSKTEFNQGKGGINIPRSSILSIIALVPMNKQKTAKSPLDEKMNE